MAGFWKLVSNHILGTLNKKRKEKKNRGDNVAIGDGGWLQPKNRSDLGFSFPRPSSTFTSVGGVQQYFGDAKVHDKSEHGDSSI
jgi:hypothetical protein